MAGVVHTLDVQWETTAERYERPEREALEARFVDCLGAGLSAGFPSQALAGQIDDLWIENDAGAVVLEAQ